MKKMRYLRYLLAAALLYATGNLCLASPKQELYAESRNEPICDPSLIKWVIATTKIAIAHSVMSNDFPPVTACKANPDNKNTLFVAVAYDAGKESEKALLLAMLDMSHTTPKKILARYDGKIEEDGAFRVIPGIVRIDTGKYFLSKNTRAFGVDIDVVNQPNCGDRMPGAEKTLYVREGNRIRPVLTGLSMSSAFFVERWNDRCSEDNEKKESIIDYTNLTLSIGDNSTNGFRDLLVTAKSRRDDHKKSRKSFHAVLRYDGRKYPTQKFKRRYDTWERQGFR